MDHLGSPPIALPEYSILHNSQEESPPPPPLPTKPPPEGRRVPGRKPPYYTNLSTGYKCGCFCFWLLLILALVGVLVLFYTILQPRSPSFNIQHFQVNAFNINRDSTLSTEMILTVKSQNPNRAIGFFYGRGSSVSMWYNGSVMSSGKLPPFRQDHGVTTLTNVTVHGVVKFGADVQERFRRDEEEAGRIPLLLMFKAPVAVVIDSFPLREIAVFVNGTLVVDTLSHPDRSPKILSSQYQYSIGL